MYKYEFKEDDLFISRVKTYPEYEIFIYQGRHYINRDHPSSGSSGSIKGRKRDGLQVFEINANRTDHLVEPFIRSSDRRDDFKKRLYNPIVKTISENAVYAGQNVSPTTYPVGAPQNISLPTAYSASVPITRTLTTAETSKSKTIFNRSTGLSSVETVTFPRAINITASALMNVAKKYSHLSKHFNFLGQDAYGRINRLGGHVSASSDVIPDRDLTSETVNMIFIPQMYYGSSIKKGSVILNFYNTGSMLAACQDKNRNGELIGTSGSTTGQVVGLVLYDEGVIMLTSSTGLKRSDASGVPQYKYAGASGGDIDSSWLYYGATLNDGIDINTNVGNASYELKFKGTNYVTTMTMMAHAKRGHLNHSNNPTYRDLSETKEYIVGKGDTFSEGNMKIKNVTSASYHSASFEKTTYISKVRLYDENNNLIGVASMANPVRKTFDRAYTFKLKLDI